MMGASIAVGACGGDDDASGGEKIPVAPTKASEIPVGFVGSTGVRILVGRDEGGLFAMTSSCTHQLCDLALYGRLEAGGITCTCHSSGFTKSGVRVRGPAVDSLKHFKVDIAADGTIVIDTKAIVDIAARTPVP
jgi:nitrite reductase/ring-hydroxylating ferredoxin subunit